MGAFFQVTGGVLIAVILGLTLNRQGKDITLLLSMAVCCMVFVVAVSYLQPVIDFVDSLRVLGDLDENMVGVMLKAVGIGLVAEIAELICADSGNTALGKAIQMLAGAVILWLSIPIMRSLLEFVQQILEGI